MAVSIKDIARLAGVSHSTVSRALRNSSLIPAATRERIQQIARDAGYSASAVARSLVTRRTQAIGVVVTTIADPFNGDVVAGIEETANERGYSVILANSQADPEREMAVVRSFQERRVDGILVASSRVGALYVPVLSELNIPIVLLNNQHPSEFVHSLTIDNVHGAYEATRHLIKLGHQKIGYVGDRLGLHSDAERYAGYRKAMTEAGLKIERDFVIRGDGKPDAGTTAVRKLLSLAVRPTGIICYNDMTALGAFKEVESRRLSVPHDLSIVGFDDLYFASFLHPPLTTIRQPRALMGRRAMQMLLELLDGEQITKTEVICGELVVRGSTASLNGEATNRSQRERTRRRGPRSRV